MAKGRASAWTGHVPVYKPPPPSSTCLSAPTTHTRLHAASVSTVCVLLRFSVIPPLPLACVRVFLCVSALGDMVAKTAGVISTPYRTSKSIKNNQRVLVVASDGLWDFVPNEEAILIATQANDSRTAAVRELPCRSRRTCVQWSSSKPQTPVYLYSAGLVSVTFINFLLSPFPLTVLTSIRWYAPLELGG